MFVNNGLCRHSELNLQCIITSCLKGGNQELLGRAVKALQTKKRKKQVSALCRNVVLALSALLNSRIFG